MSRLSVTFALKAAAAAGALACTAPALANYDPSAPFAPEEAAEARLYGANEAGPDWQDGPPAPMPPLEQHRAMPPHMMGHHPMPGRSPEELARFEQDKADWIADCRAIYSSRYRKSSGVTGALVGGALGGLVGNRIAGRGDRAIGTIAGAAVGAVAGSAIERAGSREDLRPRDYCERYLERYLASQQYGYGYGQAMVMMVPVQMQMVQTQQGGRECKETVVTEEWVDVPGKVRYVPPRRPSVKRWSPPPSKRVYTGKRVPL